MEKSLIQCLRNYKIDHIVTMSYRRVRTDGFVAFRTHPPSSAPISYNPIPWPMGKVTEKKDEACEVWENL